MGAGVHGPEGVGVVWVIPHAFIFFIPCYSLFMRVKLSIPESERHNIKAAKYMGEHYSYHGCEGEVIAGAGNDGAWVRFGDKVVGCPAAWLERLDSLNG